MPLRVERFAKLGGELLMDEARGEVGRDPGELGHGFDDFGKRCLPAKVTHDERGHDTLPQAA